MMGMWVSSNDLERDPVREALDQLRSAGLHGEAAAHALASEERFALPSADELDDLKILVFERDGFPGKQGLVVGLYVDVIFGRRSLAAGIALLRADATQDVVSAEYVEALELVAASLVTQGRARQAFLLSALLLAAVETVIGAASTPWIMAARPFIQSAAALQAVTEPQIREILPEARTVAVSVVAAARATTDPAILSTTLSAAGQYWWTLAKIDAADREQLLKRAEELVREAASLREGAERGRTLATLAQLQRDLVEHGAIVPAEVGRTAREAMHLVDKGARPLQWLAARGVLRAVAPTASEFLPVSSIEMLEIRASHGDQVACECLTAELGYRQAWVRSHEAAALYQEVKPRIDFARSVDEKGRRALLTAASHCIDEGVVPCEELTDTEANRAFARTEAFSADKRLLARLHLALHATDGQPALSWAIAEGPPLVSAVESTHIQEVAVHALAEVHASRAISPGSSTFFAFRCAVLCASTFAQLGMEHRASDQLHIALDLVQTWAHVRPAHEEASWLEAHSELQAILDACLREAAMLDADLAETMREWLLNVGRATSAAAYGGGLATPLTAVAHSEAFKGAVTSRMLSSPGPVPDDPHSRELLTHIDAIRAEESQGIPAVLPTLAGEELQLCAWLHPREQLAGSSATQRRRNLESRYDDLRTRIAVALRPPWAFGLRELPHELVDDQLDDATALLDLFLGRDDAGRYCTYGMLFFRKSWQRYGTVHGFPELEARVNPADDTSSLLVDGVAPLVAALRYHIQEPPGPRVVSRAGTAALASVSEHTLGKLADDLPGLRAAGCEHLVVCPHGPLAFVPFHLLPVGESFLADIFTVTTIPSIGSMLKSARGALPQPTVELGIVSSANGGVPFGFRAEPRLAEQAIELSAAIRGAESLPDQRATPAAALDLLARSRYGHIAAHGSALGSAPAFHCLYLDAAEQSDGRLFAHNVVATDLRGVELVTLCACETALGRVDPAGNFRGLPTALLASGTGAVVATLWPVSADAALYFFARLHSELPRHGDRLVAYRDAQRATRDRFPNLADWGAFTYIGDWRCEDGSKDLNAPYSAGGRGDADGPADARPQRGH